CIVGGALAYFLLWESCLADSVTIVVNAMFGRDRRGMRRPGLLSERLLEFSGQQYELPEHSWRTIISHVELACGTDNHAEAAARVIPPSLFPKGIRLLSRAPLPAARIAACSCAQV